MNFYFAPMEGITGYIYRNAHQRYFPGLQKYFTPFLVPNQKNKFSSRERNDVLPEHNAGTTVIPQIMSNRPVDFIQTAIKLKDMGYGEVNLNLGCPSRTVVSKGRGSGFLAYPKELDTFLEEVCSQLDMKVSIKTRIGKDDGKEFGVLLDIFNRYPLEELIIHPRVQQDFYKNTPDLEVFQKGLENSKNPVCYNGDICTVQAYKSITGLFPGLDRIMIGRGLLKNPGLVGLLQGKEGVQKDRLRAFHDELYCSYQEIFFGDKNVLFKMKEFWSYLIVIFSDYHKYAKRIKKAEQRYAYEETIEALFTEQDILL